MALEGTIKVPAVGPVKKTWALAGLGILGIILGVAYWRHLKAGPAAPAAAVKAPAASPGGGGGGGDNDGGNDGRKQGPGSFINNAAWDQAAQSYLEGIGANAQTVADALGKYLHGDAVSEAQQTVIESAIAAEGLPPVSGPGGFPPNIRVRKPGPPPPKKVRVPNVEGQRYATAREALIDAGLKVKAIPRGVGIVAWQEPKSGAQVTRGSTVTLHMAAAG